MLKHIIIGIILLSILSCSSPSSPNIDSIQSVPIINPITDNYNSDFIQIGKTYLTLEQGIWNVKDGRYSFKSATPIGNINLSDFNTVSGSPRLMINNEFVFFLDRDSLGNMYTSTSKDGYTLKNPLIVNFEPYQGNYPTRVESGLARTDSEVYLITRMSDDGGVNNRVIVIYKNTVPNNFTSFHIVNRIEVNGATDGWHNLIYNPDTKKYYLYGRKRGVEDWGQFSSSNQFLRLAMPDRRGVRILEADNIEGSWRELSPLDPINYQPNYTNPNQDIRMDYYGGLGTYYFGNVLLQVNTFFKDKRRVPSTRPERISGTGPIYPILWHSTDGITFNHTHPTTTRSLVQLYRYNRDWSKYFPETRGYLEVGQIYSAQMVVRDTLVYVFYFDRKDTHYLADSLGAKENPTDYWASTLVLDRFSSYQPQYVTCTSISFPKMGNVMGKCRPAVITSKKIRIPDGSTHVGINVDGNFTLRIYNSDMEFIDEATNIQTDQVGFKFKPTGGLPNEVIVEIELFSGDFYALKFFKQI